MNTIHPTIAAALAPFVLINKDGTPASPALAAQFEKTYPVAAKKQRKTTETFHYDLCGIGLVCELDYEGPSGDGWDEPNEPGEAYLCEAFCGDVDIVELLSDDHRREIEVAFLEQEPEYDDCPEPDFAADETSFG